VSAASKAAGWQLLSFYFDAVSGVGQVLRNGVLIGEETYTPTELVTAAFQLASNYAGSGAFLEAAMWCLQCRSGAALPTSEDYADRVEILANNPSNTELVKHLVPGTVAQIDTSSADNFVLSPALDGGGAEELTNGDFETGDMTGWSDTVVTSAAVAGSIGTPAGSYLAELTLPDGSTSGYISQVSLVIGATYRLLRYCAGDGGDGYPVIREGTNLLWTGTTSAADQLCDITFTATATDLRFYCQGPSAGVQQARFDGGALYEVLPVRVALDTSQDFDPPVANGSFENWTAGTPDDWGGPINATTTQIPAMPGGEGTSSLRLTYAGASARIFQNPPGGTLTGIRGMLRALARGDGVAGYGRITAGSSYVAFSADSTTSTTPQELIVVCSPDTETIRCVVYGGVGQYADFDNMEWVRGNHAWQPDPTRQPTYDEPNEQVIHDGTTHLIGNPPTASGTVAMWVYVDAITATHCMIGCYDGVSQFWEIITSAAGALTGYCGTGTQKATHSVTFTAAAWHRVAMKWENGGDVQIHLDGSTEVGAATGTPPTIDAYIGARNNAGSRDIPTAMKHGSIMQCARVVSDAELADWFETFKPPGAP
jgi:hypothetical protein